MKRIAGKKVDENKSKIGSSLSAFQMVQFSIDYSKHRTVQLARLELIMLLKSPIMLLSNAPFFPLLCPNYAPFLTNHCYLNPFQSS